MITPNGDGKNDAWDLREVPNIENSKVSVFNAVGELVYLKNIGYDHTWSGTDNKGVNLPVGNYLYVIEIPTEKEPLKGYLLIAH
jgi:gliding motility-associated-like protein